jgi:hypothetical protein
MRLFWKIGYIFGAFLLAGPISLYAAPQTPIKSQFSLLPRKQIDTTKMGVSAFVNDSRFGSISAQFKEVKSTLRLKYVRVLFNWNDQIQPTSSAQPDFSFYDSIAAKFPRGIEALVILNGVPSWMKNSTNWIDGNPRKTFVERWVKPVMQRYARNNSIKAWQIWNEPNMGLLEDNTVLDVANNPAHYVEMLSLAFAASREITPTKKVVMAATTAINQNYPDSLNYNKDLINAGAQSFADYFAAHVYGEHLENFLIPGRATDFLKSVSLPIWITESGTKGINAQRSYVERMWPYLNTAIPGIKRFYLYQFTEATPAGTTYGLRNLTPKFSISDLYIYLRDRPAK